MPSGKTDAMAASFTFDVRGPALPAPTAHLPPLRLWQPFADAHFRKIVAELFTAIQAHNISVAMRLTIPADRRDRLRVSRLCGQRKSKFRIPNRSFFTFGVELISLCALNNRAA